jgi:hypothetical protein
VEGIHQQLKHRIKILALIFLTNKIIKILKSLQSGKRKRKPLPTKSPPTIGAHPPSLPHHPCPRCHFQSFKPLSKLFPMASKSNATHSIEKMSFTYKLLDLNPKFQKIQTY